MEEEYVEEVEQEVSEETPEQEESPAEEAEQAEQEEQPEQKETAPPVIPRKAYEAEKAKRQEKEKELETYKAKVAEYEAGKNQPKQPQTVEEFFDADPAGTLGWVDQQIQAAQADYNDAEAQKYLNLKTNLVARAVFQQQNRQTRESQMSRISTEIYKAIPDFDSKKPELVRLAVEYGLTEQDALGVLDPGVVGEIAPRFAKMFAKVHAVVNAGATAKKKEVKTPNKVEDAGTGGFSNKNTNNAQFERAKQSSNLDDWAALLG